jgi:hypothetical protein
MLYRIRNFLNYAYFRRMTRDIVNTPPTPCRPDATCEVHTMLSARDFAMYLVAAKSFLRFHPTVAVVIHDDGSLDRRCMELLGRHVPGCRIVQPAAADRLAEEALKPWPLLYRFRGVDCCWRRLVDTDLWSRTPKRIIMDSDIITLGPLSEVISWIELGERPFLIGQPPMPAVGYPTPRSERIPPNAHIQTKFKAKLTELAASIGAPAAFEDGTTAGFYGCLRHDMPFERIESLLRACQQAGLPLEEWGGDQCAVIFLLSMAKALRLDPTRYINFAPDAVGLVDNAALIHFYGTNRFLKNIYSRLAAQMVSSLRKGEMATFHR